MSHKATTWAWEQILAPTEKIVLLAMADAANDTGKTYSANKTICKMTGLSREETISEIQTKLIRLGVIKDTGSRAGNTGRVKVFQLPEPACKYIPDNPPLDEGLGNSQSRANPAPIPRSAGLPNKGEPGTLNREGDGAPIPLPPEAEFWNANCGLLPKALACSSARMRHLSARRKDPFWVANYKGAVLLASKSKFLSGENDRGWRASFDWMIERPDSVVKILEGKYNGVSHTNGHKPSKPSGNF